MFFLRKISFLIMMSSECALVILLDEILEVQEGLDWVKKYSDKQYQTTAGLVTKWSFV